jgi:conjugative relaxase-like TrwC/TraI family protein
VAQEAFERLCDNQHPVTGEKLTVRKRQVDRRVCFDFVVSPPKSVSIMALIMGDKRLLAAHEAAAEVAMGELEKEAAVRVRARGANATRGTGEVVAARFTHAASRALDPQLHTHFVVFNASYDPAENRWKALQTERMFEKSTLFTEIYRSELARRALALGYRIRPSEHGFELEHVSDEIIERFSKRRRTILAEEAKLTGKLGGPISNNARATLAHTSRDAKVEGLSEDELQQFHRAQLSPEELESLRVPEPGQPAAASPADMSARIGASATPGNAEPPEVAKDAEAAKAAVDYARDHHFERRSVVPEWMLLREGLRHARGKTSYAELNTELAGREEFIRVDGDLTTAEMLDLEGRMITLVNRGMETEAPLNAGYSPSATLNQDQAAAVRHLLHSPDWVVGLRGGAGTGKSTLLREVARGIAAHHAVVPLAPTSAAVIELRKSGFPAAATVQRFLADSEFQRAAKGRVLMVDEAGLLSTRNMLALLETAKAHGCRVLLSGDTRQHASVDAGDALRLLEQKSALSCARVDRIVRQVRQEYREAIAAFAAGDGPQGLLRLRRLGAVREIGDEERYRELATAYRASVEAGKSTLVVSPTWREIEQVTSAVRAQLKVCGKLGAEDTELLTYRSLKWTQAQKRDLSQYRESYGLHFHRRPSASPQARPWSSAGFTRRRSRPSEPMVRSCG